MTASLALPRRFAPVLVAAALCGCSMSTEYFVSQSLRHAGFTRAATKCVVNGVAGQLADDQLETLRQPLIRYVMLDQPPRPMQISELLAWLEPQVPAEVHRVVAHHASACRPGAAGAAAGS